MNKNTDYELLRKKYTQKFIQDGLSVIEANMRALEKVARQKELDNYDPSKNTATVL